MLRVEFSHDGNGAQIVRLFGRMVGPYAEDARNALAHRQLPPPILVDLSQLTFVDLFGEQVLVWLGRLDARFIAENVYARSVCDRLQLRISDKPAEIDSGRDTSVLP
jgi:hypothetical protein